MIQQQIPICEIWLITTEQGREMAGNTLLPSETGYLSQFCRDFQIVGVRIKLTVGQIIASNNVLDI